MKMCILETWNPLLETLGTRLFCEGVLKTVSKVVVRVFGCLSVGSSSRFAPPMGSSPHTTTPYSGGPPEEASSTFSTQGLRHLLWTPRNESS